MSESIFNQPKGNHMNRGINSALGANPPLAYGATEVKQTSPVDARLADLECLLNDLRSLSAGFAVKLQNVLEPQMANTGGNGQATPKPVVAPLCERLDGINAGFVHELSVLRDIFNRISV